MAIRLKEAAVFDLRDIWTYTADNWGPDQADTYLRSIEVAFESISGNPGKGKPTPSFPGYLRWIVAQHVIFYRQDSEGITVVRVLHQRMDPTRHLE